jgi:Carboxypeptidase regulatory-like domain
MRTVKVWLILFALLAFRAVVSQETLGAVNGTLTGVIKDSRGMPMAGALVVLLEGRFNPKVLSRVTTDGEGKFEVRDLFPGWYSLKVSAASYIPLIETGIKIAAGKMSSLNLMLESLYERTGLGSGNEKGSAPDEDIESVLRTASSTRPILRILDSPSGEEPAIQADMEAHAESSARSSGFRGVVNIYAASYSADPDLITLGSAFTEFALVKDVNPRLSWVIAGVASDSRFAEVDSMLRFRNIRGHNPSVRFSLGQLPYLSSVSTIADKNLQTMSVYNVDFQDELKVSECLSVIYGAEVQGTSPAGDARRVRPRWGINFQPTRTNRFSYLHTTSLPRMNRSLSLPEGESIVLSSPFQHEFGSPLNLGTRRVTHSEVSAEQKLGSNSLVVGAYSDEYANRRIGFSEIPGYSRLPYSAKGLRVAYRQAFASRLNGVFGYTYGSGIRASGQFGELTPENLHVLVAKLITQVSHSGPEIAATYRWISGYSLTVIDPYQEIFESSSPGVSFMVSQAIPYVGRFIPGKLEAQFDVRNLFAKDTSELHDSVALRRLEFVQLPKSVRGGIQLKF